MQCGQCSNPLPETARFCSRCGATVPGVVTGVTGRLLTHPSDTWTFGGETESSDHQGPAPRPDDTSTWRTLAPGVGETSTWGPAEPVGPDTSSWRAGPVEDVPPAWDDVSSRTSHTARAVAVAVLVVLVGLGGTIAWAANRGDSGGGAIALPTTTPPAGPVAPTSRTDNPFTAGPSTSSLPTSGSEPTGSAATGSSTVAIGPVAAADPDAAAVAELLGRHFDAINAKQFDAWVSTVTPRRARDQTETGWEKGYRTTYNTGMVLRSLSVDGSGTTIATVAFTSTQDPADAPDKTSTQLCWVQYLPIEGSGSSPLIGLPAKGSTEWGPC